MTTPLRFDLVFLAAALACAFPGTAGAQARMVVKVATAGSENIIRTDIGRATFGSGIQFNTSQLRWTMDNLFNPKGTDWQDPLGLKPPVSSNTYDAIKSLKLGTLRFPHGDSSFLYISENPQASYPTLAAVSQWNRYLTPDEIVRYTGRDRLDMERIFEVNTVFSLAYNPWRYAYLNSAFFTKPPVAPVLDPHNMDMAAQRAADWVERDGRSGANTQYWEVGNEDWARWNGNQYADIFFSFQKKMKARRREIKLLAQGLLNTYERNTPDEWLHALKTKLEAHDAVDSVHAYSIHRYMGGGVYPPEEGAILRRQKQTQDILAQVADDTSMNHLKSILGTGQESSSTGKWKIWMTEFNVLQPTGRKNSEGRDIFETSQDMGNALVIADWTGKMLEQNVERMVMHSLDHNLESALVQYANGTDIEHPMVTTAGHAYAIYAQEFGKTMVRSKITGNVVLTAPNKKRYPQLAVYSSISADGKSLRVMAINRHMTEKVVVNIDTEHAPGKRWLANGQFGFKELRASRITDGNQTQKDLVRWSDTRHYLQAVTGIENITLAPASANLFIMPLQ